MAVAVLAAAVAAAAAAAVVGRLRRRRVSRRLKSYAAAQTQTPLVRIESLSAITGCTILAKCEHLSEPGASSKDRLARASIEFAEARGLLRPHSNPPDVIVEGTVGSTGIALAAQARARGYTALIVVPDDLAPDKYAALQELGAVVEKVRPCSIADANHFVRVAARRAQEINEAALAASSVGSEDGSTVPTRMPRAYYVDQFETDVNYEAHYRDTGPEIYAQLQGLGVDRLDSFVMGAGTGGTIAGVGMYLRERYPSLRVVLADPQVGMFFNICFYFVSTNWLGFTLQGSGLYYKVKNNIMYSPHEAEGTRRRHQVDTIVEGIGINRLTRNFARALAHHLIADAVKVTDEEALDMSRFLYEHDGYFCGSSTAVHLVAALREARRLGRGHTILTVLCDSGTRHTGKFWNNEYVAKAGLRFGASNLGLDFRGKQEEAS
ncbi:hypothetical protein HDU82_009104 [Entophlyctis luteolus]|nr:hypothetical protein HDU82_009104 [Entophlyctis luteolus]